jgi:nucleoside diphosphate kinase
MYAMETFCPPALDRSVIANGELPDRAALLDTSAWLRSPELEQGIHVGAVTLAMLKPELDIALLDSSPLNGLDDLQVAEALEAEIDSLGLQTIARFSLVFDTVALNRFYGGGAKERQLKLPPELDYAPDVTPPDSRWKEFTNFMGGGVNRSNPTTVLFLKDDGCEAVDKFRNLAAGGWNPIKARDIGEDTLRTRHAKGTHNNLIHGSDSKGSVAIESHLLDRRCRRYLGLISSLVTA